MQYSIFLNAKTFNMITMNNLKSLMFVGVRGYRSRNLPINNKKRADKNPFIKLEESKLYADRKQFDVDEIDEEDHDDLDRNEADFAGAHKTHKKIEK